jgi:hypothetical protein
MYHETHIHSVIGEPSFLNGYYITQQYSLCSYKNPTSWGTLFDGCSQVIFDIYWLVNAVVDPSHRATWSLNTGLISCWSEVRLPFAYAQGYPPNFFAASYAEIKPGQPYFP